ncbi:MAG: hypothetical protein Q9198_000658 [Flavoplaca austrocitrina]
MSPTVRPVIHVLLLRLVSFYQASELSKCLSLIEVGRTKILSSRLPSPLDSVEAVLPIGMVSLLVNKMAMEARDSSLEIGVTYHAYLAGLVSFISRRSGGESKPWKVVKKICPGGGPSLNITANAWSLDLTSSRSRWYTFARYFGAS